MSNGRSLTKSLFVGLWSILNVSRKVFFNLIFIVIVIAIISVFLSEDGKVTVPKGSALVLNPYGDLVIEEHVVDPFEEFMHEAFDQQEERPEVLLRDLILAIENAKLDRRIEVLVLDLHGLRSAGLDKLSLLADAIDDFKESGKPVYAIGDYFSQNQYYLASHADHIYMNPMGWMILEGYGRYRMYFKSALEKLKATTHVFKVGTYKSYVEPYIRDDMSDPVREANQQWLDALWAQYKQDVSAARGFEVDNFDEKISQFMQKFEAADGDFASYALENGWVDALKTREQVHQELVELVGSSEDKLNYNSVSFKNYLSVVKTAVEFTRSDLDKVGVVVAKGSILNGNQKPGTIGGDSTAKLLRKARLDDSIKAVVLHVDSPGGSAFASEVIRQEIENLKAAGKPVVASMSTYAASGGYWISASADQIWAAPSTITGSIGVFGMFMTYENTLDYLGIHTDGVGTTEFAGLTVTRPLDPQIGNLLQRSVESSYQQFISLVASERDMTVENVDQIAQGRVWIGETAKQLGLVDELGYLDDAIKAAADLAGLEQYDTKYVSRTLTAQEEFWRKFFGSAAVLFAKAHFAEADSSLIAMVKELVAEFDAIASMNDPKGVYLYCLECEL